MKKILLAIFTVTALLGGPMTYANTSSMDTTDNYCTKDKVCLDTQVTASKFRGGSDNDPEHLTISAIYKTDSGYTVVVEGNFLSAWKDSGGYICFNYHNSRYHTSKTY